MGFYQPAQLVRDAREHGVEVRHPDINASDWDCTLELSSRGSVPGIQGAGGSPRSEFAQGARSRHDLDPGHKARA